MPACGHLALQLPTCRSPTDLFSSSTSFPPIFPHKGGPGEAAKGKIPTLILSAVWDEKLSLNSADIKGCVSEVEARR